ncbi:MAG: prepilin-type N-terminal cleavage/methylation domain-containing protein [Candidatus Omnitrophota bacterium]
MNSKKMKRGFALIEALLSVVIISIGTIYVLQAFGNELSALGMAQDNLRAVLLLENKMAELQFEIIEKGTLEEYPLSGKFEAAKEKDFLWTLSSFPSSVGEKLREVNLTCYWKSKGKTRNMNVVTLIREAAE